jgi:hypothetical protein
VSGEDAEIDYRDVPGFPGYRIGSDGSVWSCRNGRGRTSNYRRLRTGKNDGYPTVWLRRGGTYHPRLVHRLVLEVFVGPCPEGMECLHRDGDRRNSTLSNLRWGTRVENAADSRRHGTLQLGERHASTNLTDAAVREIRRRRSAGESGRVLASEFSVSEQTVCNIFKRRTWKHIEEVV